MSWWTSMSRTFDTLRNDTVEVVLDNLEFQAYGNCQGHSSSLSEIMQILTLAVRVVVALTNQEALSWLVGAVFEQLRANRFSAAVASKRESLRS